MTLSRFRRTPAFVVGLFFAELVTIAVPITFPNISVAPDETELQAQKANEISSNFNCDEISIKPTRTIPYEQNRLFLTGLQPDGIAIRQMLFNRGGQ
jgi:hypothetical protein